MNFTRHSTRQQSILIVSAFLGLFSTDISSAAHAYKSQFGQDKYLNENHFFNKKNGVFVDIGAHDGVLISNTHFYEKELGWNGICIEPQPDIFEQLKQNRSCALLNMCIGAQSGSEEFIWVHDYANMLSGLVSTYDPRHLERLQREIVEYGGSYEIIKVPTITLNEVLKAHHLDCIDYLSIDTEGSELEILMALDFDAHYIHIIDVENNYDSPDIKAFLSSKGFTYIKKIDVDEIYCNTRPYPEKAKP